MIISKIFRYELYNFHGGLVNSGGLKSTKAYLEQILKHLYNGFRVNIEFGIGYRHQSISIVEIPGILAEFFERGLNNILEAGELTMLTLAFFVPEHRLWIMK